MPASRGERGAGKRWMPGARQQMRHRSRGVAPSDGPRRSTGCSKGRTKKKMPDAAATRRIRRRRQGTAQAENGANRPQRLRCTAPGTQSPCSGSPRRSLSAGASEIARGPVCRVAPRWRHGPGAQGPHAANALAPRHGQGENGANRPQRLRCTAQGPHAANGRPRMGQGRPRDRVQRGTARHSRRRLREGPSE